MDSTANTWQIATAVQRNSLSHHGTSVNISIARLDGYFQGCFLTTPDGVSLPVYNRNYPGITFIVSNSVSACNIQLGPLDNDMFGKWVLAAKFDNNGVLIENRQPFNIQRDGTKYLTISYIWFYFFNSVYFALSCF